MRALVRALGAAFYSLVSNPLRTVLSTLGVVIGVASIVAILALGDGLEQLGRRQIAGTTDLQSLIIVPKTFDLVDGVRVMRDEIPSLHENAIADLASKMSDDADVAAFVTGSAWAEADGSSERYAVLVTATVPVAARSLRKGLAAGRYLTNDDIERDANVVVVPTIVAGWFGVPPESLPGRRMLIDREEWEIIGVIDEDGSSPFRVHVPLSRQNRQELERRDRPVSLAVRVREVENIEVVTGRVEAWLTDRYGSHERFSVRSNRARAAQAARGMLVFKLVMGTIAGISLLVGGIGIMNIMLASVFERTREIGVRKSVGARQRDILLQFLAESVTITGVGSLLGVILGFSGAFLITAAIRRYSEAQVYAAFAWSSVLVAAGAALVVGLLFGTYPARRAALLSPIDAIRHE